jgi:hypothetical protein
MVVCSSANAQDSAPSAASSAPAETKTADTAASTGVKAATKTKNDLIKKPDTLEVIKARAKLAGEIEKVVDANGPIASDKSKTATERTAARLKLEDEVLYSPDSTLNQRYRAMKAMGKGSTLAALSYGFGSLFEDNFDRIDVNIFQPKARIYFDNGSDDPGEIDLFKNGAITPAVEVVELRFLNYISSSRKTAAGFTLSGGIGTPPSSDTGSTTSSTAPVLLGSLGVLIAHQLDEGDPKQSNAIVGLEAGWTFGVTTDEALADTTDSAFYIGFGVQIKF